MHGVQQLCTHEALQEPSIQLKIFLFFSLLLAQLLT